MLFRSGMESAEKQLEEDGTKLNEALTGMSTGLARMQQLAQEVGAYKTQNGGRSSSSAAAHSPGKLLK